MREERDEGGGEERGVEGRWRGEGGGEVREGRGEEGIWGERGIE